MYVSIVGQRCLMCERHRGAIVNMRRVLMGGAAWSLVLAPPLAVVGTSTAGAVANLSPASVALPRGGVGSDSDGQVFHLRSTSRVVVEALRGTMAASGLRSVVALEATSLAQKTADLAATVGDVRGIDGYYVDVTRGQPVVSVPAADLATVTTEITERVPNARIESSGEGARYENRGGLNLTGCTSGFAAAWNGYKGFFTAAHCTGTQSWQAAGGTTWNWSSAALTQLYNGTADIAFRRISSAVYNDMWIGTGFATISSGSGVAVVGTTYCGRGKTSGYRCAQVTSTTYTPTYTDACPGCCGPNFVRATLNYGSSQGATAADPGPTATPQSVSTRDLLA